MRTLLALCLVLSACQSSAGCAAAQQRAEEHVVALAACLPDAVNRVLACSAARDHACVVAAVAAMIACWAAHTRPTPTPDATPVGSLDRVHESMDASTALGYLHGVLSRSRFYPDSYGPLPTARALCSRSPALFGNSRGVHLRLPVDTSVRTSDDAGEVIGTHGCERLAAVSTRALDPSHPTAYMHAR